MAGRMNIVVLMHSHTLGGAERHVLSLLEGLRARGHQAHFAGPHNGWLGEQVLARGIPGLHLPMRGMYDALSALKLSRYLRRVQADVVHGHSMRGTRYAVWAGQRAGVPAIATAHSTTAGSWLLGAQHIIPVSAAVQASLLAQSYGGTVEEPVYPGVPDHGVLSPEQRRAQRALLGLKDDEQGLVILGRMVRDKGQDLAITALSQLRELPVRLFLYGDGKAEWITQLQQQVAAAGLQDRVRFLGQQAEASRTIGAFDLFLQPSRREALSLSLLEASAQAMPIIASRVGGIPEVIRENETGRLVPVDDADALAQAIRQLLADRPGAERLGQQARQQFLRQFTVSAMLKRTEAIYARCAARSAVSAGHDPAQAH